MYIHTRFPEMAYARCLITVTCFSAPALAAHFDGRWRSAGRARYAQIYIFILVVLVLSQWSLSGPRAVFGSLKFLPWLFILSPVCLWLGSVTYDTEKRILRNMLQEEHSRKTRTPRGAGMDPSQTSRSRSYGDVRSIGIANWNLATLLLIALLEEMTYRGVLVGISMQAPTLSSRIGALLLVTVGFAAAHVFFGIQNVFSKMTLSIVATSSALITGNIVWPVLIHFTFNYKLYQEMHAVRLIDSRPSAT
jgi:membrane protease YdiL (CAAX protease family)